MRGIQILCAPGKTSYICYRNIESSLSCLFYLGVLRAAQCSLAAILIADIYLLILEPVAFKRIFPVVELILAKYVLVVLIQDLLHRNQKLVLMHTHLPVDVIEVMEANLVPVDAQKLRMPLQELLDMALMYHDERPSQAAKDAFSLIDDDVLQLLQVRLLGERPEHCPFEGRSFFHIFFHLQNIL